MKTYDGNVWLLIERASDLPGEWVAHCLDLDVVSQGTSLRHALEMVFDAMTIVLQADLQDGRDPFDRRAPKEEWDQLWAMLAKSEKLPPEHPVPSEDKNILAWAAQYVLHFECDEKAKLHEDPFQHELPLAFAESTPTAGVAA